MSLGKNRNLLDRSSLAAIETGWLLASHRFTPVGTQLHSFPILPAAGHAHVTVFCQLNVLTPESLSCEILLSPSSPFYP